MRRLIPLLVLLASCGEPPSGTISADDRRDAHSYAEPWRVRVKHLDLDWDVLFDRKVLKGSAILTLDRPYSGTLALDSRDLKIERAEVNGSPVPFNVGTADAILGAPLTIQLPQDTSRLRIVYETAPQASGLQWLAPEQTGGKRRPFLFTQSQAIHARSWIPCQDTPGVRVTYTARVRTPKDLLAVMSAENDIGAARDGDYSFRMQQPVPSYLIALGVGNLEFRPMGGRTGVFAEPYIVERAASEFEDTERMIEAAEALYGRYRWGRYDLLVLPPSFPYGGMENPRLTFVTPTVIAGDKSLVALIAHELAHSWSGNLVTNATWEDFWLNEGFTTYVENRIVERVYGESRARMEAALSWQELQKEFARLEDCDEILMIDLKGRDPDENVTDVPYEKGALLLRALESRYGRQDFDEFLRAYFDNFAFQSITTRQFLQYLHRTLLKDKPMPDLDEWLHKPGLPASAAQPKSAALETAGAAAKSWAAGEIQAHKIPMASWTTQETLRFLRALPQDIGAARMAELDKVFRFTRTGNYEVLFEWLMMSVRNGYRPAYPRLEQFLIEVGRRKYVRPLYEELVKTPEGKERAKSIYKKARPGYHPITQGTVDKIVKS
jgi:leukotriene A-4 hydrolase/aminopeptidase